MKANGRGSSSIHRRRLSARLSSDPAYQMGRVGSGTTPKAIRDHLERMIGEAWLASKGMGRRRAFLTPEALPTNFSRHFGQRGLAFRRYPIQAPEAAMDLQVSWDRTDGVLIASPGGRVDNVNSAAFREALESEVSPEERALLLDLGDLAYMSSAGLSVLLWLAKRFRGSGKAMGICRLPGAIAAVVALSGFNKIIPVYETRAEALAELAGLVEDGPGLSHDEPPQAASGEEADSDRKRPGPRRWSFKMHST